MTDNLDEIVKLYQTVIPIRHLCEEMGWRLERSPTRLLSAEQVARNPRAKRFLRQAAANFVGQQCKLTCEAWTLQEISDYIGLVMSQVGFETVAKPNGDRWMPDEQLDEWRLFHSIASRPDAMQYLSDLRSSDHLNLFT